MAKKEDFEKQGFEVIDGREITDEEKNHLLEFLKNNYPSIYKDGEINIEELKRVLNSKSSIGYKENGYGLNFIGRNLAKAKYRQKTEKELSINEKLSKNFDETENVIIKGDNLDSLKILKKYYSGKIKCIYIDPPYNTNSDNFLYPDKFDKEELEALGLQDIGKEEYDRMEFIFQKSKKSHNGWLTFMYPRLKLARDLLTDDGAIFISIDDNEQANLKLLCDDIFGEDNFISTIVWANKEGGGKSDSKFFRLKHEYILVYSKNIKNLKINPEDIKDINRYTLSDNHVETRGKYQLIKLDSGSLHYSKSLDYEINIDGITLYAGGSKIKWEERQKGKVHNKDWTWRWSKEKLKWGLDNDFVKIKKNKNGEFSIYTKQYLNCDENGNIKNRTLQPMALIEKYSNTQSNKNIKELFGYAIFNYSKPYKLIIKILEWITKENDIVLDFFAGSGTTAHAVMQLNAEDGGNRKFILCQIDEKIDEEKSVAYNFCIDNNFAPVISSITVERVNRAGDKILKTLKESNDMFDNDKKIDIGYKVFDLHDINIEKQDKNKQIILLLNGVTDLSRIYNMIINIGLNSPISKLTPIIENCAYMIEEDNIKRYYITNSEILIKNDENKQKFKEMIESGNVYIDGWTATINVSLQQYKDNVKIIL